MTSYDYIIVGAGTAGCVLAARLSQDPGVRVLLLEAGDREQPAAAAISNRWPELIGSAADWGFFTTPQAESGPVIYPRGRVLGGSGEINAMAHMRGHRAVYDAWAAGGAAGWADADLLPYFKRSEVRAARVPHELRHPVASAFAAALCAMGWPMTDDLGSGEQEGVAWPDLAIAGGQRVSPAGAYLRPVLDRPGLTVQAGCLVTRLLIDGGRCTGVSYSRGGSPATAHADREVIVCAGAVGSPQLLLLSGIGPASQLRAHGIDPVADLPGVGANLQDHPIAMACYATAEPLPASRYNHGETYSSLRSHLAGAWPDLQLFPILLPLAPPGHQAPPGGFALVASVTAPDSRGSVRLARPDPAAAPLVDPGFLREPADLDRLEAGLSIARQAAAAPAFAALGVPGAWRVPDAATSADLRSYIRQTITSYYHPAGTCRMGREDDPAAVTDPHLRVHGVAALRVADASVMPVIPNAPLNATVLAIAEKAADLITHSPGRPPRP